MQTNKPTTFWQPQVPRSCVCNSNTNYFHSNCQQENDSQKICARGSVPSQPTRKQFLSIEFLNRPAWHNTTNTTEVVRINIGLVTTKCLASQTSRKTSLKLSSRESLNN